MGFDCRAMDQCIARLMKLQEIASSNHATLPKAHPTAATAGPLRDQNRHALSFRYAYPDNDLTYNKTL